MIKLRKLFAVLLSVLMVAALLAGCGGGQAPRTEDEPEASTGDAAPADDGADSTAPAAGGHQPIAPKDVKVGFIAIAPPTEYGYNLACFRGYEYVQEQFPEIETVWIDNVPDTGAESETVMEKLVREGCNMIFAVSFGYMDNTAKLAEKYPDVYFLHCSQGKVYVDNMTRYDITTYDAAFVSGYLAGKVTESNKLGYVSAQPIPTVLSAANGFALGAKYANPDATVNLFFTNSWSDPSLEKEAAQSLIENGCDVLAQFADSPSVQQVAQDNGVYSIGFHVDMRELAPQANISSFVYNYGKLYAAEVQKFIDGTWKGEEVFPGMVEGYADIAPINTDLVSADIIAEVEEIRQKVIDGEIVVYAGEIKDNEGTVRVPAGEVLEGEDLQSMDWLVDNIEGASI